MPSDWWLISTGERLRIRRSL
jgi:hypothetical protein